MFDQQGLHHLGFETFSEAFNTLGLMLGAKPASIKNYRDELDPYFSNNRKGWHNRPLRSHCKLVMDAFKDCNLDELGRIIQDFVTPDDRLSFVPDVWHVIRPEIQGPDSAFAKRLITGEAAESYFRSKYHEMPEFGGHRIRDTTRWGCGFDFRAVTENEEDYLAIEVKGLRSHVGQIQLTELEHKVASVLNDRYYIVLVRNFVDEPYHTIFQNPVQTGLDFMPCVRHESTTSWVAKITA
jgi:hypothetical protein